MTPMSSEHVIVLFTDLVGSTELSTSRSPELADQLRRRHFAVLRRSINATGGQEAKSLGDGVMVIFNSASSAIACAVSMQQGVTAENIRSHQSLQVRIGVSGGEVSREGDDYFGDPVVEAARLCAASEGGQILASDVVRLIAGRRNVHATRTIGPLVLKGLPDPVVAVEIQWTPSSDVAVPDAIPLPSMLSERSGGTLAGRVNEMAALGDWVHDESSLGRLEMMLITGEAGLGKTTLAAAAARATYADGACVLVGHCEEGLAVPYQPFARAIEHFVRHAEVEHLDAHVSEYGSALARLAPSLARRVSNLPPTRATDPDSERYLLFAALVGLLADISTRSAVVMVFDDLQWADDGSLTLLRHLASSDQSLRLRVVATCRDNEIAHSTALVETLGALQRQSCLTRLDLVGLGVVDVTTMMAGAGYLVDEAARTLAANLLRETDGNPFFVLEVLRHLIETGLVSSGSEGYVVSAQTAASVVLPRSLIDVIAARLARLGPQVNGVLTVASVIGREFTLELLSQLTAQPVATVLDVLDDAVAASLVHESADSAGRFNFAHALIQHALYESVGLARRSLLHGEVALALEALHGEFGEDHALELARHWSNTGRSTDLGRAVRYSCLAGDGALRSLAPVDALRLYERAQAMMIQSTAPDELLAIDVATGLGTAQRQSGDASFRETLLVAARRAAHGGDTQRLVRAVLANSRGWYSSSGVVDWDRVTLLELALEKLTTATLERALVLGTLCSELAFSDSLDRRLALGEEALSLAREVGDDASVVRILNLLVFPHLVPPLLERSLAWSAESLRLAETVGDPLLWFSAAIYRATVATRAGDIGEVDRCFAVASQLVAQLNQPSLNWEYTFHLAKRAQIAGNLEEAELLAGRALQIGTECGEPDATTFFGVQYAVVAWQNGTMEQLAPIIEQMITENPGLLTIRASLAMALSEGGLFDECRQVLEEFAATKYELRMDTAWINGMTEYAVAAINLGEPQFAVELYERLRPYAAQFSSAGGLTAEGPVCLFLGQLATVLGRYDEAAEHLDAAVAFTEKNNAWFFGALSIYAYGQMLARRGQSGDARRAREYLRRAQALGETRGYARVATRAATELARLTAS